MKAKYTSLYKEHQDQSDSSVLIEVRLEKWRRSFVSTRYILEWGTREPCESFTSWLASKVAILDGHDEAAHIRSAIAKFDELTGGHDGTNKSSV